MLDRATISDRARISWWKKLNPIWWFRSDTEQPTPDWYHPEWPRWRRNFYWYALRNPLRNLQAFVLGVQDKNYTVYARAPWRTVQRDDLVPPELGFQYALLIGGDLWVPRLFLSYSGTHVVWQIGWQPSGIFALKFNLHAGG